MPAHIHPSLSWFTCESRPSFNGMVYPGSVSETTQGPPRAQSPFARSRRYLHRRNVYSTTSEGVTPPSSLIRTHAPDQIPPVLFVPLLDGSLQVVASPCWEMTLPDVISAILAWVLGPLPRDASLVLSSVSSQRIPASPQFYQVRRIQNITAMPLQRCPDLSRRQSFRYVQAPMLARPPDGTYRADISPAGSRAVYTTQWTGGYPPELWHHYMTESDNYHGGT